MMATLYPIGIQNFESLRKDGFLYIDKTALIYQLVQTGRYFFLSPPRRFGKSLLISTLEAYFQGKKELFKGLAMEQLEKDWIEYPILHLDLNTGKYDSVEQLMYVLDDTLHNWELLYGRSETEKTPELRFKGIVRRAYEKTGRRVVILVDEYDKPLLQAIGNEALQEEFRNMLKPFYGVLKTMDGAIRFALLTGVTKFGKVSVFSDLNNLDDLSMRDPYVTLCGISEEELHAYFDDDIHALGASLNLTFEGTCSLLKKQYDGYHFTAVSPGVYNPFSLLNAFKYKQLGSYWFETGTPTYLVELLKRTDYDLYRMAHTETDVDVLNSIDAVSYNPIPVIYQSGYLTIKDYDPEFKMYTLGFPNEEVSEGFTRYLLPFYTSVKSGDTAFQVQHFVREIRKGDVDAFLARLQSFFSDTPYELIRNLEVHYQNVLFIVFKLVGFYAQVEYRTSRGRIDLVLQTDRYIYVMEFKLNGTAEEALRQIEDRQYALPFASDPRTLFKIGVSFDDETRNIAEWIVRS
ncbi:ATP-binding protein [Parabacteroides goldsteinii]|uniref:ATP-binding protein n=1 Tax=Parabacteroides goldsteinii TaxID=328812 RepID=UPI00256F4917|nr:ATP-binding protein [Parabacteroides goldsteinii]